MAERMEKTRLIELIRATSTKMELLLTQLNVEQMNQPGAVGVWSVKDVVAHIAFWERYAIRLLEAVERGETPELAAEDDTETRNASVVAQYYLRPLSAVLADWHEAREDLIELLAVTPDEVLNDGQYSWNDGRPLWERVAGNSYEHEQEHIDQIRAWMQVGERET
jgi:hypothetical protein